MNDIIWEAELAYRRQAISDDFRQAGGGRSPLRPRTWGRQQRTSFPRTHARRAEVGNPAAARGAAALGIDGSGGGHVRR